MSVHRCERALAHTQHRLPLQDVCPTVTAKSQCSLAPWPHPPHELAVGVKGRRAQAVRPRQLVGRRHLQPPAAYHNVRNLWAARRGWGMRQWVPHPSSGGTAHAVLVF